MKINICVGGRFHASQLSDVIFENTKISIFIHLHQKKIARNTT